MILRFNNNGYDDSVVTLSLTELIRKFEKFENYLGKVWGILNKSIKYKIQYN